MTEAMSSPLLTVALRVHRRPLKLRVALNSICAQSARDLAEVLAISDDPSDVESHSVLDSYSDRLHMRRVDVPARGWPGCNEYLNTAASEASGTYITPLDDDDAYVDGDYFRAIHAISLKASPDIIITRFSSVYPHLGLGRVVIPPNRFWEFPPVQCQIGAPCICIRREEAVKYRWTPTPTGDFDFISSAYHGVPVGKVYWHNKVVVSTQNGPSFGKGEY